MTLRFLTAGESHGPSLTAILDGIPAGLPLSASIIDLELARRQKGYGSGGRMKIEKDMVRILGGVMAGETTGAPKLLAIGHYRMGFELSPQGNGSMLRVFIEYALPEMAPARWLGRLFGKRYARWCTQRMVDDAVRHFAAPVAR